VPLWIALTLAAWVMDFAVRPLIGYVEYSQTWFAFGELFGTPLLVLPEYPLAAALWAWAIRLLQQSAALSGRAGFYAGLVPVAVTEETANRFLFTFWYYPEWVTPFGPFLADIVPIVLIGWLPYWLLADAALTFAAWRQRE